MNLNVENQTCFVETEKAILCLLKKTRSLFKLTKPGENFCLIYLCYRDRSLIGNLISISDSRKNCDHIFIEIECVLISSYKFIDYRQIIIDNTNPIILSQL